MPDRSSRQQQVIDALRPFAEIGALLFARPEISDDTPLVDFHLINGVIAVLTRGDFKAANLAYRELLQSLGQPAASHSLSTDPERIEDDPRTAGV